MRLTLALLLLVAIPAPYIHAQIQTCIDVRSDEKERNAAQGVYDFNNKWTPGTTLTVSFLDGTTWQQEQVRKYAVEWSLYANIQFRFLVLGSGRIRISFAKKGSYSYIGTDAKDLPFGRETMNLGWINEEEGDARIRSVILHEFGHSLGLLHEHMSPLSNIQWNKPVVYAYYLQYNGWDKNMVDRQVFDRYTVTMTNQHYDPKSIMHYSIPANFTLDGYTVGENFELSEGDKGLIAELYPYNTVYPPGNKSDTWSKLESLTVNFNATQDGRPGISIAQDFKIYNARGSKCIMAAYFYNAENSSPLVDHNGRKASSDGQVAALNYFTPKFAAAGYQALSVFMPYDELELDKGKYRLKCYVAIFDADLNLVTTGGYQYFTFSNGAATE